MQLTYTGDADREYPGLGQIVDGETVGLGVPVPGQAYDVDVTELPTDGRWVVPGSGRQSTTAPVVVVTPAPSVAPSTPETSESPAS